MNIILIAKPLRENTNTKANALNNGWARSGSEEFKKFSHFVGVDKGIVRTNVLTGKKLSDKIRKEVDSGDSKQTRKRRLFLYWGCSIRKRCCFLYRTSIFRE